LAHGGLWIVGGKLNVAGKPVAEVPMGQWIHVDVSAGLGDQSTGIWELKLTLPGQPPQTFAKLPCNPQWKQLDWLGFVSNADAKTVFYLDNLQLESSALR
jgi:hypothetical protein